MITVRGLQAVSSSLGINRVGQDDSFYSFTDEYDSFCFEGSAIFRKYYPGSMIITPRDTGDSGIFLFASVEWGNPVVLESIRATLFTSISNSTTDIKELWAILNDHLSKSFSICPSRVVIGKIVDTKLCFVSAGLGFYRWKSPFETVEILGLDYGLPALGMMDTEFLRGQLEKQRQINDVKIDKEETILFLPDYLIFNHRWSLINQLEENDRGRVLEILDGQQMLESLLSKDSSLLTDKYFSSCFTKAFNFSGFTEDKLFEYMFALDVLNKGSSRKFLERSSKWNERGKDYFLCTQIELEGITKMLDKDVIRSIKKVKLKNEFGEVIRYKVTCNDTVFPETNEFEDLAVLKVTRQP